MIMFDPQCKVLFCVAFLTGVWVATTVTAQQCEVNATQGYCTANNCPYRTHIAATNATACRSSQFCCVSFADLDAVNVTNELINITNTTSTRNRVANCDFFESSDPGEHTQRGNTVRKSSSTNPDPYFELIDCCDKSGLKGFSVAPVLVSAFKVWISTPATALLSLALAWCFRKPLQLKYGKEAFYVIYCVTMVYAHRWPVFSLSKAGVVNLAFPDNGRDGIGWCLIRSDRNPAGRGNLVNAVAVWLLKQDDEVQERFARRLFQESPGLVSYLDAALLRSKRFMLAAVQQDGCALKFADRALHEDKDVVLAAVQQNGRALRYADDAMCSEKQVVLVAVQQHGSALYYAGDALRADKEVVLAAVCQNGKALQYADGALQNDKEVVAAARADEVLVTDTEENHRQEGDSRDQATCTNSPSVEVVTSLFSPSQNTDEQHFEDGEAKSEEERTQLMDRQFHEVLPSHNWGRPAKEIFSIIAKLTTDHRLLPDATEENCTFPGFLFRQLIPPAAPVNLFLRGFVYSTSKLELWLLLAAVLLSFCAMWVQLDAAIAGKGLSSWQEYQHFAAATVNSAWLVSSSVVGSLTLHLYPRISLIQAATGFRDLGSLVATEVYESIWDNAMRPLFIVSVLLILALLPVVVTHWLPGVIMGFPYVLALVIIYAAIYVVCRLMITKDFSNWLVGRDLPSGVVCLVTVLHRGALLLFFILLYQGPVTWAILVYDDWDHYLGHGGVNYGQLVVDDMNRRSIICYYFRAYYSTAGGINAVLSLV